MARYTVVQGDITFTAITITVEPIEAVTSIGDIECVFIGRVLCFIRTSTIDNDTRFAFRNAVSAFMWIRIGGQSHLNRNTVFYTGLSWLCRWSSGWSAIPKAKLLLIPSQANKTQLGRCTIVQGDTTFSAIKRTLEPLEVVASTGESERVLDTNACIWTTTIDNVIRFVFRGDLESGAF